MHVENAMRNYVDLHTKDCMSIESADLVAATSVIENIIENRNRRMKRLRMN
jgi:hypothetical protein